MRHTGQALTKLEGMSKAIDAHCGVTAEFQKAMSEFVTQPCKADLARQVFTGFIVRDENTEEVSTRAENQIDDLVTLFRTGKGNTGKDFADVFNATTDYYTHDSSGGDNRWKQFESSEFGMGNRRKTEMFQLLRGQPVTDLGDLQTVINRGNRVMQLI